jgi:hypothetical protein
MDTELVNKILLERRRYIDYFEKTVQSLKKDTEKYAIELPIQTDADEHGAPFNIIRVDFITKNDKDEYAASELRLDSLLNYPTTTLSYKDTQIDISPFCWNSCEFLIDKVEINDLKKWIIKWQKIEDETNNETIANAIHSCTEPKTEGNKLFFIIDFGTASEMALIDFLEVLNNSGTTAIKIQTSEI